MKSIFEAFHAPITISLSQLRERRKLTFRIYPIVLLLIIALLFITISVAVISILALDKQAISSQQRQIHKLVQQQSEMRQKSAESEAQLSLKDAHIAALEEELQRLQHQKASMQTRLDMFDEVLAARKIKGVHILRPSAAWQEQNRISYELILVKGGNYPRWSHGRLQFSVLTNEQEEILLLTPKGKNHYKFEMTTQGFVNGVLAWPESWHPETLFVTMFNERGKQTGRITVPILKRPALAEESPDD